MSMEHDTITIIDFGSQYTQLIARRLRELGTYTDIQSSSDKNTLSPQTKGIILSGGPASTRDSLHEVPHNFLNGDVPVLGICFGMQLITHLAGGVVETNPSGEFGHKSIQLDTTQPLFQGLEDSESVWMSHGDSVKELPSDFKAIAHSSDGVIAAIRHARYPLYGVQFHPEVTHTPNGAQILSNFLNICKCARDWTVTTLIDEAKEQIRQQVGRGRVVSLVSGGVDSTVATLLCREALGNERVIPIHVDTGLMRHQESSEVTQLLHNHGLTELRSINARQQFLSVLKGVTDPETKRQRIGDLFMELTEEQMQNVNADDELTYLCQGTLYTDLIESGKGCGKHAAIIKSHHNVNTPLVLAKREAGLIVEPNQQFFKDEVRQIAQSLGVPHSLSHRHPFPGPGLAIRILGEVTAERLDQLRQADHLFTQELHKQQLYDEIWQAFAVLIPSYTVGVMGDKRTMGHIIALRAVTSIDGMTADSFALPHEVLQCVSTRIVNEVSGINRVVYDVTSKPPGTIEWE